MVRSRDSCLLGTERRIGFSCRASGFSDHPFPAKEQECRIPPRREHAPLGCARRNADHGNRQSSSITTGLCILLVQQEIMAATAAIPVVIGDAKCRSTVTATHGQHEDASERATHCGCQSVFRIFGVVLFLPFLGRFAARVVEWAGIAVAWAQLILKSVMILAVLFTTADLLAVSLPIRRRPTSGLWIRGKSESINGRESIGN